MRAHLDETYPEAVLVSEWGDPEEALHAGFDMDFLLHFGPSHYLDLFRENPYFSAGSSEATGSAETAETEHDGECSECDGAGSSGCDSNGNSVVDGDNPNCNNDNVGNASGDIKAFVDTYTAMLASTAGTPGYICIPSGNHDMIRMRDTLTTDEMKLAFTFLLTMPGCPFIYYGDEIGMRYMHGLKSKEGGYERTGSRTPMQWSCATNAGFSAARPDDLYLPIDADSERPNVASQTGRSDSLLETVRALNTLRLAHPALQADGGIESFTRKITRIRWCTRETPRPAKPNAMQLTANAAEQHTKPAVKHLVKHAARSIAKQVTSASSSPSIRQTPTQAAHCRATM